MRPPKGRASYRPGPVNTEVEKARAIGIRPEFYDPEGKHHGGLPTYPFHFAPAGYSTVRELRKMGLRPGGQPIQAQIIWKHRGPGKHGRGRSVRRVAYLFKIEDAKPKRTATPAQRAAIEKALAARRTCPTCRIERDYYIPRSLGECVPCAFPDLADSDPEDAGNGSQAAAEEWDPEEPPVTDPGPATWLDEEWEPEEPSPADFDPDEPEPEEPRVLEMAELEVG